MIVFTEWTCPIKCYSTLQKFKVFLLAQNDRKYYEAAWKFQKDSIFYNKLIYDKTYLVYNGVNNTK